jgi:polysaccharide biosynthesis/export protein
MKSFFTNLLIVLSVMGSGNPAAAAEEEYRIGAEDVLHIIVWDNKDLEQTVVVRPDGKISFPLAGEIQAEDLTVPQLTEVLTQRLSIAVKNPNVSVMVKEMRSFRVHVAGKIARPGTYPIKAGTPLLQALTLAGGTSENADLSAAYIVRKDKRVAIDLRKLIQEGDLSKNVRLERDDTIVVPEIAPSGVYIMGQVMKPGVYSQREGLSLLRLVSLAGGFTPFATPSRATLIRREGDTKILKKVDLKDLMNDPKANEDLSLQPGDILIVP